VKSESRLLLTLAITLLIILVMAINFIRPSVLSVAALVVCILVTVFVFRWIVKETASFKRTSSLLSQPSFSHSSSKWLERPGDPDKLIDRLVSAVEDIINKTQENPGSLHGATLHRELHRHLGNVIEESVGFQLGGQNKEVTILFSDLRGFSVLSEEYSARELVEMLNRYFSHMCEIIYRHGGTVDKFIGDSIMALFGAPVSRPNDTERAVCCAAEMQIRMDAYNKENESLGLPKLYMGIGMNTGEVAAGKIGSDLHSEYTVIGNEVNLTSRIEAYTLRGQILFSEKTYAGVKDLVTVGEPIYVPFKGKREPVALYELLAIGEPYDLKVPEREARRSLRVNTKIPFKYQLVERKVALPTQYEGHIRNISPDGMFADTIDEVEPYCNMIFKIEAKVLNIETEEIYGKVVKAIKGDNSCEMHVEFTTINPEDRATIKDLVNKTHPHKT
jgi:adenylate cyclase